MATHTPFEVITHTRRVCSLYKRCLRSLQDWTPDRAEYRYKCAVMRSKFDQNRDINDIKLAVKLVEEAEQLHAAKRHFQPYQFPRSPGGIDFERYTSTPDWALDFWDPIEKGLYPEYFKLREQRKREYLEMWEKKYGKENPHESAAH